MPFQYQAIGPSRCLKRHGWAFWSISTNLREHCSGGINSGGGSGGGGVDWASVEEYEQASCLSGNVNGSNSTGLQWLTPIHAHCQQEKYEARGDSSWSAMRDAGKQAECWRQVPGTVIVARTAWTQEATNMMDVQPHGRRLSPFRCDLTSSNILLSREVTRRVHSMGWGAFRVPSCQRGFATPPSRDQRQSSELTEHQNGPRHSSNQRPYFGGLLKPTDVSCTSCLIMAWINTYPPPSLPEKLHFTR